jgi:hypothetical protein
LQAITVKRDPKTEKWLPRPEHLRALEAVIDRPVTVHYHLRSNIRQVWEDTHQGRPLPVSEDAFRAFVSNDAVHLFVDDSETYESALWLLVHELAHTGVATSRLLTSALRSWSPRPKDYLSSDDAHEAHFEERVANHVADRTMAKLGLPTGLDRIWWRKRRNKMLRR